MHYLRLMHYVTSYRFTAEKSNDCESRRTDCSDRSAASFYDIWNICKQVSPRRPHLHIWCMTLTWLQRITRRQARPAAARFVVATKQLFASVVRVGLSGRMPIIICENLQEHTLSLFLFFSTRITFCTHSYANFIINIMLSYIIKCFSFKNIKQSHL